MMMVLLLRLLHGGCWLWWEKKKFLGHEGRIGRRDVVNSGPHERLPRGNVPAHLWTRWGRLNKGSQIHAARCSTRSAR
jgi:hypothetical protein